MISEAELFAGTAYNKSIQHNIYADIQGMHQAFPGLRPYPYKAGSHSQILIQGDIVCHEPTYNYECLIPITMALLDDYPRSPPKCQIVTQNAFSCVPSQCFTYEGVVNSPSIIAWVERQTTLVQFVQALTKAIDTWRPIPPHILTSKIVNRPELVASGVRESAARVGEFNREQQELLVAQSKEKQVNLYVQMVADQKKKLEARLAASNKKLSESAEMPCEIDPQDDANVRQQARDGAFLETVSCLRQAFQNSAITLDQMVKTVRDLGRSHFEKVVYPRMCE